MQYFAVTYEFLDPPLSSSLLYSAQYALKHFLSDLLRMNDAC